MYYELAERALDAPIYDKIKEYVAQVMYSKISCLILLCLFFMFFFINFLSFFGEAHDLVSIVTCDTLKIRYFYGHTRK